MKRFLLILLACLAAVGLSIVTEPYLGDDSLFLLQAAVVMVALYGGFIPGVVTTGLTALAHSYFHQAPYRELTVGSLSDRFELALFVVLGILLSWLAASLRRALERAEAARHETERAVEAREEILAVVSHDLKNPLSAVKANTQLVQRLCSQGGCEPTIAKVAGQNQVAVERMEILVRDLLDFEKIRAGTFALEPADEDLGQLFSTLHDLMSPLAAERRVALDCTGLRIGDPRLSCDRERLLQVLSNLVGNAIRHTPPGGQVTVSAEGSDESVRFEVSDTGSGIPDEHLPHLFDRFWQPQKSARDGGAGLGLAIARGIVEAHGGWIDVKSEVGRGSTFYFVLPRNGRGLTSRPGSRPEPSPASRSPRRRPAA